MPLHDLKDDLQQLKEELLELQRSQDESIEMIEQQHSWFRAMMASAERFFELHSKMDDDGNIVLHANQLKELHKLVFEIAADQQSPLSAPQNRLNDIANAVSRHVQEYRDGKVNLGEFELLWKEMLFIEDNEAVMPPPEKVSTMVDTEAGSIATPDASRTEHDSASGVPEQELGTPAMELGARDSPSNAAAAAIMAPSDRQELLRQVFVEFDLDKSGGVGEDEMFVLGKQRKDLGQKDREWTRPRTRVLMRKIGMNQLGQIPLNSFVRYCSCTERRLLNDDSTDVSKRLRG